MWEDATCHHRRGQRRCTEIHATQRLPLLEQFSTTMDALDPKATVVGLVVTTLFVVKLNVMDTVRDVACCCSCGATALLLLLCF